MAHEHKWKYLTPEEINFGAVQVERVCEEEDCPSTSQYAQIEKIEWMDRFP